MPDQQACKLALLTERSPDEQASLHALLAVVGEGACSHSFCFAPRARPAWAPMLPPSHPRRQAGCFACRANGRAALRNACGFGGIREERFGPVPCVGCSGCAAPGVSVQTFCANWRGPAPRADAWCP